MKISNVMALCLICVGSFGYSSAIAAEAVPKSVAPTDEMIYKDNCSVCHGDKGDGRSRASNGLVPPPRNFTEAGELMREYMIFTVANGKPGTAMTAWKTRLSPDQIEGVVDYVRNRFMQDAIDTYSSSGRMAYAHHCKSCHGEQGQGVLAQGLTVAPRSFSAEGASLTRERMIAAVTKGVPGTLMWGYSDKMSPHQIGAVVDYVRRELMAGKSAALAPTPANSNPAGTPVDLNLPMPKGLIGDARLGENFFMGNCAACHGTLGDGQGPRAYFMTVKPRNFLDEHSRSTLNRPAIFSAATDGRPGTEMPAWGKVLSEQEIANVAEYVFQAFIQKKTGANSSSK